MGFERRMHPVLAEDLNILLTDLCNEWDFCAGVRAADLLEGSKPLTSKKFTDAVLDAKNLRYLSFTHARASLWCAPYSRTLYRQIYGPHLSRFRAPNCRTR